MKRLWLLLLALAAAVLVWGGPPPANDVETHENLRRQLRRIIESTLPVAGGDSISFRDIKNERVGIGTTAPASKLEVSGGDVYINQTSGRLIMKSPDGSCSSCGPNNADVWSCSSVTCP